MRSSPIVKALPFMVKHYSHMFNIDIEILGNTACSTRNKIVIPNLNINSPLLARITYGFLAHEAAHIRYSNFDCNAHLNNPLIRDIVNALEDSRVEKIMSANFRGVHDNLRLLNNTLALTYIEQFDNLYKFTKFQILLAFILFKGQEVLLDYAYSSLLTERLYTELTYLINVKDLDEIIEHIETGLKDTKSTIDVIGLSLKIYNIISRDKFFIPNIEAFYKHYKLNNTDDFNFCTRFAKSLGQPFNVDPVNLDLVKSKIRYESQLTPKDFDLSNFVKSSSKFTRTALGVFGDEGDISSSVIDKQIALFLERSRQKELKHKLSEQEQTDFQKQFDASTYKRDYVQSDSSNTANVVVQTISAQLDKRTNTIQYTTEKKDPKLLANNSHPTSEIPISGAEVLRTKVQAPDDLSFLIDLDSFQVNKDSNGSKTNSNDELLTDANHDHELLSEPPVDNLQPREHKQLELPLFAYSAGDPVAQTGIYDLTDCAPEEIATVSRKNIRVNLKKLLIYYRCCPLTKITIYNTLSKRSVSKAVKPEIEMEVINQKFRQTLIDELSAQITGQDQDYIESQEHTLRLLEEEVDFNTHCNPPIQYFDSLEQRKLLFPLLDKVICSKAVDNVIFNKRTSELRILHEKNRKLRDSLIYQRRVKILQELGLFDPEHNLHNLPTLEVNKYLKLNNGHVIYYPDPYATVNYDGSLLTDTITSLRTPVFRYNSVSLLEYRLKENLDYNRRDPRLENSFLDAWREHFQDHDGIHQTPKVGLSVSDIIINIAQEQKTSQSARESLSFGGGICKSTGNYKFIKELEASSYGLRRALYQKVKAWSERYNGVNHLKGRNVDPIKAMMIPLGEEHIFKQRTLYEDYSTFIHLLVDISGSMNSSAIGVVRGSRKNLKNRCYYACKCALALALALDGVDGVTTEATFFPGGQEDDAYEIALMAHEKAHNVKDRFCQEPRGSTPMAEAIWYAIEEVEKLKCHRNIVIIITDGMPNSVEQTKLALDNCKERDIEVYTIGLNRNEVLKELFERFEVMDSFVSLPKIMRRLILSLFEIKP